jgi:hypothetical protein
MFTLLFSQVAHVSTVLPAYFDTYGRREPTGPAHIPTSFLAGQPEQDFFSLLKRDAVALASFGVAMRMTSGRVPVTGVYDMGWVLEKAGAGTGTAGRETVWVDVGGGDGHTVGEFLRVYGDGGLKAAQCVVQDLEEVVVAGRRRAEAEEGVLRGVRWVGLDFLREAPVEGKLVLFLFSLAALGFFSLFLPPSPSSISNRELTLLQARWSTTSGTSSATTRTPL